MQGPNAVPASVQGHNNSEVARLLSQIRDEHEAALRGVSGYAQVSKHQFITQKMDNMGKLHEELKTLIGDEAIPLTIGVMNDVDVKSSSPET